MMKIAALTGALALAMTTAGLAQTTGPSGQQDTNKPGMANPDSSGSSTSTDGMRKSNTMGTTGSATKSQTKPGSSTGPSGGTAKPDAK